MRLEITARAARDLRELHSYGIREYGAARADVYLAELFGKFDHAAQWPFSARQRFNVDPPVRLNRQRAHNIVYTADQGAVSILRVFHHSVNWIDLL